MNYTKIIFVLIIFSIICIFHSCKPEEELTAKVPTLYTTIPSNITDSTAISGGDIISSGASIVTERGVCWAIFPQPTINDNKTNDGEGTGIFTSYLTGLNAETYYYVRAYATNIVGTGYGDVIKFFATSTPTVTTFEITNITSYSAVCGGNVISDGGSTIIKRGVCWSNKHNPTINDSCTHDAPALGSFISNIKRLTPDSLYYVRAYATNANNLTGYGEELSFKPVFICGEDFSDNRDGQVYKSVLIGNQCWMKQNLNYGTYVSSSTGQSANGTQKFCYSNNPAFCNVYGGMYIWSEIMNGSNSCNGFNEITPQCSVPVKGICPDGWHIPSHYEWTLLEKQAGSSPDDFLFDEISSGWYGSDEGQNLKINAPQYWNNTGNNTLGFDGLAGGYYLGVYGHIGDKSKWWTSSETNNSNAWHRGLKLSDEKIYRYSISKDYAFSLRCIRNH